MASAHAALLQRTIKPYPRQPFAIPGTSEEIVAARPFVELRRFVPTAGPRGPRVLLVAPLSGHHATLVRQPCSAVADHDVTSPTGEMRATCRQRRARLADFTSPTCEHN